MGNVNATTTVNQGAYAVCTPSATDAYGTVHWANQAVTYCITSATVNGVANGSIPANGGYWIGQGDELAIGTNSCATNIAEYYSHIGTGTSCPDASWHDDPHFVMLYNGQLVQEITDTAGTLDPNTGIPPCFIVPTCTFTPTPTVSNTLTNTFTYTPTPSFTPAPLTFYQHRDSHHHQYLHPYFYLRFHPQFYPHAHLLLQHPNTHDHQYLYLDQYLHPDRHLFQYFFLLYPDLDLHQYLFPDSHPNLDQYRHLDSNQHLFDPYGHQYRYE